MPPFLRTALAVLLLSACSALVPTTAARLSVLDPLTADPAALELVVILPPGLAIVPGSARLDLSARRGAAHRKGSFRLADRAVSAAIARPEGATARGFALADADAAAMRALQAEIAGWKRDGRGQVHLGIAVGGCAIGDGPAPEATGSVLIRLRAGGPFLPLISQGRLADLLGAEVMRAIKPCQAAQ